MFKNWFSRSTGERLKSRSRPANPPKPHTSSHSKRSSIPTHITSHNQSYDQRRSTTTTTSKSTATKKPHASIVVRKDGNIEVVTPRATVVVPKDLSNVSGTNGVSPIQHRSSAKTTSHAPVASSRHTDSEGSRESTRHPKRPHSSRSEGLPIHVSSRSSSSRPRRASYTGYSRDYDYAVSSTKAPPPAIQMVPTNKLPRRGSYPLSYMPGTYAHEPIPMRPEVVYQPAYPQTPPVVPHALYPTPAPRPRRSLSNADSISSYYSDYSGGMHNTHSVPRGWYNRRGDQYMRKGVIIMQPPNRQWHPVFESYPDVGKGWMDENGNLLAQGGGNLKGSNGLSVPSDIHIN